MPLPSLDSIKERKLVQWALTYLAGAWLVLQVVVALGGVYGWPVWLLRAVPVALVVGFFGALVLAWYHGERGAQRVSRVEASVLSVLLVVGGGAVALVAGREAQAVPLTIEEILTPDVDQTSLAVLPFETVGPDSSDSFADGLTEELLVTLASSPSLAVVARTSAFAFRDSDASADSIGRALNVAHLVEGTVRTLGDRVRVAATLVDARTGRTAWSDTYERDLADAFGVQDEIARAVAYQLKARITAAREQDGEDPEAHELALEGRQVLNQGTDFQIILPEALRLFSEAVAIDSTYANAWAGLATVRRVMAQAGMADDPEAEWAAARQAAERAVALDDREGWAHYALGAIAFIHDGDAEAAQAHFERAVEANPSDARALGVLATVLQTRGDETKALRAAARAAALDPLSPAALNNAAAVYSMVGQYDRAIELAQSALALLPDAPQGMLLLASSLALADRADEAVALIERGRTLYPDVPQFREFGAFVYGRAGDRAGAERMLDGLTQNADYARAAAETALGQPDAAFAALSEWADANGSSLAELESDPWFAPLHDDPRWDRLAAQTDQRAGD